MASRTVHATAVQVPSMADRVTFATDVDVPFAPVFVSLAR